MSDLSSFPITRRWPPVNPDVLQLYSLPTPNGVKVSIMLEETVTRGDDRGKNLWQEFSDGRW